MTIEHPHIDHRAGDAGRQAQRGVPHVRSLFAEDGAQQLLFRGHRAFALGRDLAAQDVTRLDFGADGDDARLVEVAQGFLTDVRDIASDFLRPELGVAGHDLELLEVDRGEDVVTHDALRDQDRVLEVVAIPRHEGDKGVAAQSQFAEVGRGTVRDHVADLDLVTHAHDRALVDAGRLVRTLELGQAIDVDARTTGIGLVGGAHHDPGAVDLLDDTVALGDHNGAGVDGHDRLHAGADQRRVGLYQRHGLTLHVGAHQRAVGVIVFEEGNEGGGDRHDLLRRHVHHVDVGLGQQLRFTVDPARDQIIDDLAVLQLDVGLGDDVLGLFHRRNIDDVVRGLAVLDPTVGAFDEAVLVHPGVRRQRVDQADVRAFRRFDRADPAVVGRVHVADFKARALTRQTARSKRRQATLVGDFRQRVGLVHELGQLRRPEEFAHGGGRRLGVDQVVRHDRVDIDRGHALLDGALHPQQADAVLVLQQLTDRTHPAVAQVVDVVDLTLTILQADQDLQDLEDVVLAQHADFVADFRGFEAHVHLHAADRAEVVALRVEEQGVEHRFGGFRGRRLARAHHAIDVEQCFFAAAVLVHAQGVAHVGTDRDVVDVQDVEGGEAVLDQQVDGGGVQLVTGLGVDLAVLHIDRIGSQIFGDQGIRGQRQSLGRVPQLLGRAGTDLGASGGHDLTGVGVDQVELRLHTAPALGLVGGDPGIAALLVGHGLVEGLEDLLAVHAQRHQEGRGGQLAAAVDTDEHNVLGVELEVQPRPAIGNDPRGEQQLARAVRLALVVVEEDAWRTVHLRDDHTLGAVDGEGALVRHERDIAHVDVLLLDVLDRAGARFLVGLKHDQAQLDLERRGIGHVALDAFLDVILGRLEFIRDVFQHGAFVEVLDREDGLEDRLDALIDTVARARLALQELFVRGALHLDQVRHLHRFRDAAEGFADTLFAGERRGGGDLSREGETVEGFGHSCFPISRPGGPHSKQRPAAADGGPGPYGCRCPPSIAGRRPRRSGHQSCRLPWGGARLRTGRRATDRASALSRGLVTEFCGTG